MHNQRSKKLIRKQIRKRIRKSIRKTTHKSNKKRGGMYKHAVEPTLEEIKSNISICFELYLTKYGWYEPVKKDVKSKAAEITNEFYEIAKKLITENKNMEGLGLESRRFYFIFILSLQVLVH